MGMKYFSLVQHSLSIIVMAFFGILIGVAMVPSYLLFYEITELTNNNGVMLEVFGICISLGLGYILWGISILLICGFWGMLFKIRKKEGRYPLRSFISIQWAFGIVSHRIAMLFLKLVLPSFVGNLYYRMMGAKIGNGVQIVSDSINDAAMISIGDNVVIGGRATINGHLVERGEIVLAPVKIGNNALIGGGCIIQPGSVIGEGSVIASRAVVPKWSNIPDGEVWGGIPAKFIKKLED